MDRRGSRGAGRRAVTAAAVLGGATARAWFGARRRGRPGGPDVAAAVRASLERLGPAFVKLGQLISVRPDVFPPDLVFELSKLQDEVAPEPYESIERVVAAEFGRGPAGLFESFEKTPLAAGSVAQVHVARTRDGEEVVVKILRPGAERLMALDLAMGARLARWARALGIVRGIDAVGLVEEFRRSTERELDLRVEAAHADRFAFLFSGDPDVCVPRVSWRRTSRRVLTMERIDGWTLGHVEEAQAAGIDTARLARAGARAFMRQVLVFGFFHADLHPANIMLTREGRIAYLDMGIVGRLDARERSLVARLLAAFTSRDAVGALAVSRMLGVRVPAASTAVATRELGLLLDEYLADGGRVRFAEFGRAFLALLRRHDVRIPSGYGLLVKALVTVEGASQTLAPDINLVVTARPVAGALALKESLGPTMAGRALFSLARGLARLQVRDAGVR